MQAPVALMFCAMAFWKKGWLFAPMPHTRTFKSRVARGADPWADMSEKPPALAKLRNRVI